MTFTARDLFEAERQGRGPSAEARARVRAKLVKRLGASAAVAAAAAGAATPAAAAGVSLTGAIAKVVALCVLGGTVVGAGYVATHRRPVEDRPVASVAAVRSTPPPAPNAAGAAAGVAANEQSTPVPLIATSSEPAATPSAAQRAPVPAAPVRGSAIVPAREESAVAEPAAVPSPPVVPESVPEDPAPAAAPASADGLQAELALVRAAHDALRAGKPDVALERMDQHKREFPNGALAEERDALRVSAICALGRADAAAEAQTFLASHPGSPFVARIRDACPH
jgi:hypothetical protein